MPNLTFADLQCAFPDSIASRFGEAAAAWDHTRGTSRLWDGDASLWTGRDEARWLGWLDILPAQRSRLGQFTEIAKLARDSGCAHAMLLGMGGSSLCPEVLAQTLGDQSGFPSLHVLDSTDPTQLRAVESRVDPSHTLFIVASKSGTTLEPDILRSYFWERAGRRGDRFIAITDPGSRLEADARRDGYRAVYHGVPEIGGRFSALSDFGLVPAALMGLDVGRLLSEAERMAQACRAERGVDANPGVTLGVILGALGRSGVDKLTLVASPGIAGVGAWLEQLVAESTGKHGKAIIPVDGEQLGPAAAYGRDRLFVYLRHEETADRAQDDGIAAIERAGLPVVRIAVPSLYALGAEFFRWEVATAVAGSLLGVNPFDQPDVEASKIATRELTNEFEKTGALPPPSPAERAVSVEAHDLPQRVRDLLAQVRPGDYVALLAWMEMNPEHTATLQALRHRLREATRKATCLGFGPRFLHSTGQAYKGGPNTGIFFQITSDTPPAADVPVPGRRYTFGIVRAAQAAGDLRVLRERGRRVLSINLGQDPAVGLVRLERAVTEALK